MGKNSKRNSGKELEPNEKSLVSNYSEWFSLLNILPNPYDHLAEYNIYEIFRNMRKYDSHIRAAYNQRRNGALAIPWEINPASESAEDKKRALIIKEIIEEQVYDNLFSKFLAAVPDGFATIELGYKKRPDGYWGIGIAKAEHPEIFRFSEKGDLLLYSQGHAPKVKAYKDEMYPNLSERYPNQFITHTNDEEFSDKSGNAVLAACYWPWVMKKAGWSFWNKLLERFGVPSILALFKGHRDAAQKEEQRKAISAALMQLHNDSAGAMSDIDQLIVLETKGKGDDFLKFVHFANSEMSKAFLTETLTLETQGVGSYALGEVHVKILDQKIIAKDVLALQQTLNNTLIKWLYIYNWGDAPRCKIVFDLKQRMDIKNVIELIKLKVPIGLEQLKRDYHAPIAEDGESIIMNTDVSMSKKKTLANPYF